MNVKLDLGKMDLDPKQVQQVTEALIALSWGRHDLCLNVKQAAYGDSDERYQAAWNAYGANTTKFDQFAMLALEHRPSAVQVGAVKPGVKTEVKPEGNPKDKQDAAKKLSEAIQKWLEAYGEPKKAVTKQQAAEAAEVSTPSTENKKQSLYRLSRELIQRPLRSNSEIGL